jgi:hypothetical protein
MPGPVGVPRADIIALLGEGHSDREIGRRLHTNPKRVQRIRAEFQLPRIKRPATVTVEQKWRTLTTSATGDHLAWTGHLRGATPMFMHHGHNYSARRVAFRIATGCEPVGRVKAGCGWPPCVAPEHATDEPMRRADALYGRIFGSTA